MGLPSHYSRDLVARCECLLANLMPVVEKGLEGDGKFGGVLTTTFLLAMATPMIVLPIERIYKNGGVGNDSEVNKGLTAEVKKTLDGTMKFGEAPYFSKVDWRLVSDRAPFNIAAAWPADLLKALGDDAAAQAAKDISAKAMMTHLRNALAHGGVTYLDKHGEQSHGQADMLGFASTTNKGATYLISRVSQSQFASFISAWADWILRSGVADKLSKSLELAA